MSDRDAILVQGARTSARRPCWRCGPGAGVVVLDDLSKGNAAAVLDVPLVAGVQDAALVATPCGVTSRFLVHFAACRPWASPVERPERYFDESVGGTAAPLRAVLDAGVRHVVFSSTAAVYGTPQHRPIAAGPSAPPGEPVRRDQAADRPPAAVVRGGPRHDLDHPALLQRRRRRHRRPHRRGLPRHHEPRAPRVSCWAAVARCGSSAPTTRRAMAPVCATTCTSRTWPRPMCWPSSTSAGRAVRRLNLGTGVSSTVLEALEATRVSRPRGTGGDGGSPARRPRRAGRRPWAGLRRIGWKPSHGLDDIAASAWSWHSTLPEGYPSA